MEKSAITLYDKNKKKVVPVTKASITYMDNGNSVENEIEAIKNVAKYNKGYFNTKEELFLAYPNGIADPTTRTGWHCVVGSTDTIWIWDIEGNEWKNSGNIASAVTSVNSKVGDVVLTGEDIDSSPTVDTEVETKTVTGHLTTLYSDKADKNSMNTQLNRKLDKVTERDIVYATDKFANQITKQYNIDPYGDGLAERTQDGRLKGTTAIEDNDLVNLEQFNNGIKGFTNSATVEYKDGLAVNTLVELFKHFYDLRKGNDRVFAIEVGNNKNTNITTILGFPNETDSKKPAIITFEIPTTDGIGYFIRCTYVEEDDTTMYTKFIKGWIVVGESYDNKIHQTEWVNVNDIASANDLVDKQESERYALATDEVTQDVALDIISNYANHEGKIIEFLTNKEAPNKTVSYGFCMSDKNGNQFLIVIDLSGQITQWNKIDYRKNNVEYQLLDGLVDCDNLTLDKVGDSAKYYAGLNNPMNNPENVGDYGALMVLPYDFRNQLQIYIDITAGKFYFRKVTGTDGSHSFSTWNKMGVSDIINLPVGTNLLTYNWNSYSNGTWFKGKELLGLPQDITEHTEMMIQLVKYENDRYAIMLYHTGIYEAHVNTFINYHYADKFRGWEKFATNIVDASEGAKGIIQIASDTDVTTGTNTTKAITPKQLRSSIDEVNAVRILNKGVVNATESTIQEVATKYVVDNYSRQPKQNDGLIITFTDLGNDKIEYVYSEVSKGWYDIGRNDIDLTNYLQKSDVVNSFVGTATDKPLSAYIGNQLYSQLSQKAGKDEIPSVAGFIKNEPNAFDYNNLKGKPTIPTKLSELSGDATHRVVTDTEKSTWNNKSNFDGDYNSLSNKPTIPDISGLATKTELGNKYDKTGGTINGAISATGNVSGNYLIGNWFQAKGTTNLGSGTYDVPVLRSDGWIYKRTKDEFKSDLGLSSFSGSYNDLTDKPTLLTLDKVYPVGAVYISVNSTSPSSLFGGSWEALPSGKALWTTNSNAGQTIDAGLPNLTGEWTPTAENDVPQCYSSQTTSGVFTNGRYTGYHSSFANSNGGYQTNALKFDASKSNSIYGNSTTVQPPAYTIYAWKRTA